MRIITTNYGISMSEVQSATPYQITGSVWRGSGTSHVAPSVRQGTAGERYPCDCGVGRKRSPHFHLTPPHRSTLALSPQTADKLKRQLPRLCTGRCGSRSVNHTRRFDTCHCFMSPADKSCGSHRNFRYVKSLNVTANCSNRSLSPSLGGCVSCVCLFCRVQYRIVIRQTWEMKSLTFFHYVLAQWNVNIHWTMKSLIPRRLMKQQKLGVILTIAILYLYPVGLRLLGMRRTQPPSVVECYQFVLERDSSSC